MTVQHNGKNLEMEHYILVVVTILVLVAFGGAVQEYPLPNAKSLLDYDGVKLCQSNCVSGDRLVGPTKMEHTRDHPWKVAPFPTKLDSFCKLGCQVMSLVPWKLPLFNCKFDLGSCFSPKIQRTQHAN